MPEDFIISFLNGSTLVLFRIFSVFKRFNIMHEEILSIKLITFTVYGHFRSGQE